MSRFLLTCLLLMTCFLAEARQLILVNAVYAPFVNPEGDPSGEGIDVEIAREALRRGGGDFQIELRLVPWKRAVLMLEQGDADFTTTISKNGDRERTLLFTRGYRESVGYHFYARKGSNLAIRRMEDLGGKRLGVASGFFYPEAITGYPGIHIEQGQDMATAIRMLELGRSDLIIVNAIAGFWEIRRLGLLDKIERQPLTYSSDSPTYMAFSRARDPAAYESMQRGLAAMQADGSLRRIEQKYLKATAPAKPN
jgi:polar amino acid transport system substrate-binding protein